MGRVIQAEVRGDTKHFVINMEAANESVRKFRKETKQIHGVQGQAAQGFQRMASAAGTLYGPLNGISGRFSAMATALRTTNVGMIAVGAGITAMTAAMAHGLKVASETERQMARLEGVLQATGHAAGFTAKAIDTMARDIAMSTLASTAGVRDAAAALATFSNISGQAFEKTLRLSQDVAEVMGTDIRSAALQMAKAMDDPLRGLTALRRAGVSFSAQQREQIKEMVRWGETMKAQGVILAAIEGQLGGVAEKAAEVTTAGAWDSLKQNIDEVAEALAKASAASSQLNRALKFMSESLLVPLKEFIDPTLMGMDRLSTKVRELEDEMRELINNPDRSNSEEVELKRRLRWWRKYYDALMALHKDAQVQGEVARKAAADRILKDEADGAAAVLLIRKDMNKEIEKLQRQRDQLQSREAGISRVEKVDRQFDAQLRRWEQEKIALTEKYRGDEQLLAVHHENLNIMWDLHAVNRLEAYKKDSEEQGKELFRNVERTAEAYDLTLAEQEDFEDARQELREAALAGAAGSIHALSSLMENGSKEQRVLLVAEKALLISQATMNMHAAIGKANKEGATRVESALAIAQAIAFGTQAIAGIASVAIAGRAQGGPVYPGGQYMVGEHGPEVITVNQPGMVHSNASIAPNINVNIVEDASRAGTVEPEGEGVNVYVNAVMNHLNSEFSQGRGLFASMENKYGLTRR